MVSDEDGDDSDIRCTTYTEEEKYSKYTVMLFPLLYDPKHRLFFRRCAHTHSILSIGGDLVVDCMRLSCDSRSGIDATIRKG